MTPFFILLKVNVSNIAITASSGTAGDVTAGDVTAGDVTAG